MSADRPRISTEWALAGQPAVVLENRALRAVVLPRLGGKIISLVDKHADLELLWRNPRVPVREVPTGAVFDDAFLGGWDELFPNDEPETLGGEPMPDHGELWTQPWSVTTGSTGPAAAPTEVWVELTVQPPVSATLVTKRLTLGAGPDLVVEHRLENASTRPLPFLWKSHVAVALRPESRIVMAADRVRLDGFGHPRGRPDDPLLTWPHLVADGVQHDLRRPPDTSRGGVSEFLLAETMHAGRCGVVHPDEGSGLGLEWDLADLPSCWSFASYGGGWRGLDVLVLEPCTGYPLSVSEGVAAGTHRVLGPHEVRSWQLRAVVGTGIEPATEP